MLTTHAIIDEGANALSESHFKQKDQSGFIYNGGAAFTVGTQMQSADQRSTSTTAAASTVGSTNGNVVILAGNHYQQTGSNVLAPNGDIDIHAKSVSIVEARETSQSVEESKFRQAGLTVAVTAPVISALQTADQMKQASSQTGDGRMKALAGGRPRAVSARRAMHCATFPVYGSDALRWLTFARARTKKTGAEAPVLTRARKPISSGNDPACTGLPPARRGRRPGRRSGW